VVNLDYVWRICLGLGAVPAAATIYARLTLPESPRYSVNVMGDKAAARKALVDQKWIKPSDTEKLNTDSTDPEDYEKSEQANAEEICEVPRTAPLKDENDKKEKAKDFKVVRRIIFLALVKNIY
jgi:hypothetical protein